MSDEVDAQLEQSLRELTAWNGPTDDRWRAALDGVESRHGAFRARMWRLINQPSVQIAAACIAVIAIGLAIATSLPRVDPSAMSIPRMLALGQGMHIYSADNEEWFPHSYFESLIGADSLGRDALPDASSEKRKADSLFMLVTGGEATPGQFLTQSSADTADDLRNRHDTQVTVNSDAAARQVVRKATIELKTTDVRAVFLKTAHLIEEAGGEFVQDSALTGTGAQMQANLTLRVDARRLPELLNALRELAEVVSERVGGQDVTSQVVDLEARLRNETRVEQEMLELLDKREDAPLKEVLELRSHLSNVRRSIEQLTAQRDRLGRLVSLATVLVIIRGEQAEPPKQDDSIGAYFVERMRAAWMRALVFLVDTGAMILSVVVGGILWWVLLVAAIVGLRRYLRGRADQA